MQLFFGFDNSGRSGEDHKQLSSGFATKHGEVEFSEIFASGLGKAIQTAVSLNADISRNR